jgi:hypothetical protein
MADDTTTAIRKKYSRPYDDPLNPVRTEHKPVSEKQRRLWQALYEYITGNGGTVTSIPFLKTLDWKCRRVHHCQPNLPNSVTASITQAPAHTCRPGIHLRRFSALSM